MSAKNQEADKPALQMPLRLWPGVVAVVLLFLVRFGVPIVAPEAAGTAVMGGLVGGLAVFVWWTFFSRAPRFERWGAVPLMVVAMVVTRSLLDESVATAGMGMLFYMYAIPVTSLALVVWAVATQHLPARPRRVSMVVTILLASGVWTLVRTGGITGTADSDFAWRWAQTPEERLLAQAGDEPMAHVSASAGAKTGADWPAFRGPGRNGTVPGVRIDTDWAASPPVELWRRPIGPGWSSFSVRGDLLYTQEQRGDDEVVASYRVSTGEPVWRHRDQARFWESNGGAGPRGTPTLHDGRAYAFGATGILNALDADDGTVVWSRNAVSDTGVTAPIWGFSSSPLVVDDVVIVAASGALIAYDLASGNPRWFHPGPVTGESYSSPQLFTIDGVEQVVLMSGAGATSFLAASGKVLWEHQWRGAPIVQPAQTADGDVLLTTAGVSGALGLRRIAVTNRHGGWTLDERWTSNRLKPYFNDFVVHDGHAYGFDGSILACIDLANGERQWKGGRYGHGQLVLLPDQDVLLVLSEDGELALVSATSDQFTELARVPAIEGKTWNHPVLVGDVLLVRNGEEMVAFKLSLLAG